MLARNANKTPAGVESETGASRELKPPTDSRVALKTSLALRGKEENLMVDLMEDLMVNVNQTRVLRCEAAVSVLFATELSSSYNRRCLLLPIDAE